MTKISKNKLITTALYYANGDLHIGHMLEAVQADIYVRFLRQKGEAVKFISGNDAHGTPIMITSKNLNLKPEELVKKFHDEHKEIFKKYNVEFDEYGLTSSQHNQATTYEIYKRIKENDKIFTKDIEQAFDTVENMFLPDRYIKGDCPKCKANDQYGDSCESCGAFYEPLDMENAISTISNTKPIKKKSEHIFFDLKSCSKDIRLFLEKSNLQGPVINKLSEWLDQGLKPWDISRDEPYYGFKIPGFKEKYFYVWMDAPIAYISIANAKDSFEHWNQYEITHFIGKDIIYFHGLFWPAVLNAASLKTPDRIFTHGFLTINGQKMSKSRGTMISAKSFIEKFSADQYRYFIASKTNNNIEDIDIHLEEFVQKINSDLIGKYLNIASRTSGFISKNFSGSLASFDNNSALYQNLKASTQKTIFFYEGLEFAKACKEIMKMTDLVNQEIAEKAPWKMIKEAGKIDECHKFCSEIMSMFIDISILLKPIAPEMICQVQEFVNINNLNFDELHKIRENHKIQKYPRIMERLNYNAEDLTDV